MKKAAIVILVCVNLAILLALMLGPATPSAKAQAYRGAADYLLITGHFGEDWDGVYIIDMGKRKLLAWQFNRTSKKLTPIRGRLLKNDFRRRDQD